MIVRVVTMLTDWMRWRKVVGRLNDDAEHGDQVLYSDTPIESIRPN